ncbi:hypothetical protein ATL40_0584 [Serinibacter salmoneus]|uniref:Uncharacterized protein n=1 Tax=Serinibacter salmoneus TaxID=556530 RepID=A0A2A9CZK7_9MICO|nr:hypothetical protein ATL40_0584 [Serinibacter salmoneus]
MQRPSARPSPGSAQASAPGAQAPSDSSPRERATPRRQVSRAVATLEREPQPLDLPGGSSEHRATRRFGLIEPGAAEPSGTLREVWRAVRAGLETVLLSWLIAVVPVVATYVATVASPVLGESSWADATAQGTRAWLLGWGEPFPVSDSAPVTLVPLVLPLIAFALIGGALRRAELLHAWAAAITGGVMALGLVVGYLSVGASPTVRGTLIALALLGLGVARAWFALPWVSMPGPVTVHRGLRAASRTLIALVALGVAAVLYAILRDLAATVEIHQALRADVLSGSLLVLAELALLPTFGVWAAAFFLTPGFHIGLAQASPLEVVVGPLPVLPIFAAFPNEQDAHGLIVAAVPLLVVAALLVPALCAAHTWLDRAITGGTALAGFVLGMTGLAWLSGGWSEGASVGPLSDVGTAASEVALAALVVGVLGAGLALAVSLGLQRWGVPERAREVLDRHLGADSAARGVLRAVRHPLRSLRDARR